MKRVYYKDELFFYELRLHKYYECIHSYLAIYVERQGFWKFLSKYQCIVKKEGGWELRHKSHLRELLEEAYKKIHPTSMENTEFINCSESFESLMKF